MSSPYLNMVTSFGAILLSIVCFMYGLDFILEQEHRTRTILCQVLNSFFFIYFFAWKYM